MNQEVMELYKQRGRDPRAAACRCSSRCPSCSRSTRCCYSIELRGAPFALWIKDLSGLRSVLRRADPDGISMLGAAEDDAADLHRPGQQKMFMLMARDLTVMFLWAPSGLNIYCSSTTCSPSASSTYEQAESGRPRAAARGRAARHEEAQRIGMNKRPQHQHRRVVNAVTSAMGLQLQAAVTETPRLLRVNLSGEGAEWLVAPPRRDPERAAAHTCPRCSATACPTSSASSSTASVPADKGPPELAEDGAVMADKAHLDRRAAEMGPAEPLPSGASLHMAVATAATRPPQRHRRAFMKTVLSSTGEVARTRRLGLIGLLRFRQPVSPAGLARAVPLTQAGKTHLQGSVGGTRAPTSSPPRGFSALAVRFAI